MRHILSIVLFLSTTAAILAQQSPIHIEVSSTVDTATSEISRVIRLWEGYLNSKPDSICLNPYWVESEQRQYQPFDLVAHTWWGASFYAGLSRWKVSVLSASRTADSYIIRTMFYGLSPNDSGKVSVVSIFQTGARLEDGSYKLCNVLPINTRYWKKEQVGSIKFVFPPDHQFNRVLAERMNQFIDSLATVWQIAVVPIEYYFADDFDRVAKALGFDYYPAEGNISGRRGFTDVHNRLIYSGGSGEWYPHEFVHVYLLPLFPNAHNFFHEGYATLVGGSGGHDLSWHIRRNYEYLKDHPDIDVLSFEGVDAYVDPAYFIGGLLCKMANEKGGITMIRKLMTYGKGNQNLYRAMWDIFGIDKEHINDFLRNALAEHAAQ